MKKITIGLLLLFLGTANLSIIHKNVEPSRVTDSMYFLGMPMQFTTIRI